jgi:hypothetical protein
MSKPMIRIVELDGTIIDREMNDLEFQQHQKDIENSQNRKAEAEAKAEAKAAAQAKLAALGLTVEDLTALGL